MALQTQQKTEPVFSGVMSPWHRRLDREALNLRSSRKTREDLLADLAEIDFQLDYGSPEEARREIDNALQIWPKHSLLRTRLRRVMAVLKAPDADASQKSHDDETQFDTAYFEIKSLTAEHHPITGYDEQTHDATHVVEYLHSADELLGVFRKGIEDKVSVDDCDTHYNLGIAYKEMMLIEPAMEAFKLALRDPARTLDCCSVLAICEEGLGNLQAAIAWLRQGIAAPGFSVEESLGLQYHLGVLLLEIGDTYQAHQHLRTVGEMDAALRQQARSVGA